MELINFNMLKERFNYNRYRSVCYRYFIFFQYIFLKIVGLSPWTLDTSEIFLKNRRHNNVQINECKISYVGSCYNILLFSFIGLSNFYFQFNSSLAHVQSDSVLTPAIRAKLKFIAILCIKFIPLIYVFRQKILISVINRLKCLDEKLKKCENYIIEKNNYHINLIFIVNFLCSACTISILLYHSQFSIMTLLLRVSPDFIGGWVIVQYTISLKIIDRRFKSINSTITKLGTITNDRNGVKTLPETQISLSHEIESIKYAYIELCEMCDDIAEFYGLPVLISIIHYVTINIIRLYFIILSVLQIKKYENIIYLCNGIALSSAIFLFIVLTSSVTATIKQVCCLIIYNIDKYCCSSPKILLLLDNCFFRVKKQ